MGRRGVAQFRQAHFLQPLARRVLDRHLPKVTSALRAAGARTFTALAAMPPSVADREPRPGDDRFVTVTARRPVAEYAFGSVAARMVDIRRDVQVSGLVTGAETIVGVPHVTGVRLASGETVPAALVVDAMGRRSRLPDWLGGSGPGDRSRSTRTWASPTTPGSTARSRHRHRCCAPGCSHRSGPCPLSRCRVMCRPGSITIIVSSRDKQLKRLREADRWTRVVAACPRHAHWLDGEPITEVLPMAGIVDRYRRFVVDGTPVVTGVVTVGDSWACTNPSLGRGIALGLMHAVATSEAVRDHFDDPAALAFAHDNVTETQLTPWFRQTLEFNRAQFARDARSTPRPTRGELLELMA